MIEKTLLDYLSEKLREPISMEVPANPPAAFVVLEKTGSGGTKQIHTATFAIQSYAGTMLKAAELNERVKAAMENFDSLSSICRVRLNSDYNYTDTASKRYRYQAVFDLTHY